MSSSETRFHSLTGVTRKLAVLRKQRTLTTLYVAILTLFIDSIAFSIVIPTLALYLKEFISSKTPTYNMLLGFIIASHSLGQGVCSPFAGWWAQKRGSREPMISFLLLFIAASIFYSLARQFIDPMLPPDAIQTAPLICIMVSRLLTGIADSNITICRAVLVQQTSVENGQRVRFLGYGSAAQSLGWVAGTVVVSAFGSVDVSIGPIVICAHTCPGWISATLGLVNLALVMVFFFDQPIPTPIVSSSNPVSITCASATTTSLAINQNSETLQTALVKSPLHKESNIVLIAAVETHVDDSSVFANMNTPRRIGCFLCLAIWFCILNAFSLFETIATPFLSDMGYGEGVVSLYFILSSIQMFVMLMWFVPILHKMMGDRWGLVYGLIMMALGLAAMPIYPHSPLSGPLQFCIGSSIYLLGYPVAVVVTLQLYSLIVGHSKQSIAMSYVTLAGCSARVIGPQWASNLYALDSTARAVYLSCAALFVLMLIGVSLGWDYLVAADHTKLTVRHEHRNHQDAVLQYVSIDDREDVVPDRFSTHTMRPAHFSPRIDQAQYSDEDSSSPHVTMTAIGQSNGHDAMEEDVFVDGSLVADIGVVSGVLCMEWPVESNVDGQTETETVFANETSVNQDSNVDETV